MGWGTGEVYSAMPAYADTDTSAAAATDTAVSATAAFATTETEIDIDDGDGNGDIDARPALDLGFPDQYKIRKLDDLLSPVLCDSVANHGNGNSCHSSSSSSDGHKNKVHLRKTNLSSNAPGTTEGHTHAHAAVACNASAAAAATPAASAAAAATGVTDAAVAAAVAAPTIGGVSASTTGGAPAPCLSPASRVEALDMKADEVEGSRSDLSSFSEVYDSELHDTHATAVEGMIDHLSLDHLVLLDIDDTDTLLRSELLDSLDNNSSQGGHDTGCTSTGVRASAAPMPPVLDQGNI
jgi:hypothetical protein